MDHSFLIPGYAERVNLFANSAFLGAISGSPGIAPTGWTLASTGGTLTYDSGDESIQIAVTASRNNIRQTVAVAANTVYCVSVIADLASTSTWQNMLTVLSSPAGTTWSWQQDSDTVVTNPSAFPALRNGCTLKLIITTVGTAGNIGFAIGGGILSNQTSDMTFWQPQFEAGSNRTGYERTL